MNKVNVNENHYILYNLGFKKSDIVSLSNDFNIFRIKTRNPPFKYGDPLL